MSNESYPKDWRMVTLVVSPKGECHAIGGDTDSLPGDEAHYPAFDIIKDLLEKGRKYDDDMKRAWEVANSVNDHATRSLLQAAEQFIGAFMAFQQQMCERHPKGYQMITPNGLITLSTTGGINFLAPEAPDPNPCPSHKEATVFPKDE